MDCRKRAHVGIAAAGSDLASPTTVEQALILVGGRGTRLGYLTQNTPKPMLEVGGEPFLTYVIRLLKRNGLQRMVLCTGHLAESIEDYYKDGRSLGVNIEYSREQEPLGTGGAILNASAYLDDLFFVLNGDTLFDFSFLSLSGLLLAYPKALAALALRYVADATGFGLVELRDDRVASFLEKSSQGAGYVNGGVYLLRKAAITCLPPPPCSLEQHLFPLLASERLLLGLPAAGSFAEIGHPASLERARHLSCFEAKAASMFKS